MVVIGIGAVSPTFKRNGNYYWLRNDMKYSNSCATFLIPERYEKIRPRSRNSKTVNFKAYFLLRFSGIEWIGYFFISILNDCRLEFYRCKNISLSYTLVP